MALNKKRAENKTGQQHSTVKTTSLSDAAPPCDFLISRQLLRLYCMLRSEVISDDTNYKFSAEEDPNLS